MERPLRRNLGLIEAIGLSLSIIAPTMTFNVTLAVGAAGRAAPPAFAVGTAAPAIVGRSFVASSAPSVASYYRLTPNRWAPVRADLGMQGGGAARRVAPVFGASPEQLARQFNAEFRVADASNCPYLPLGALVRAHGG